MNIKLICASLFGVSSIGGAVAGGIYLYKSKTTKSETKVPAPTGVKPAETTKPVTLGASNTGSSGATVSQGGQSSQVTTVSSESVA